MTSNPYLGADPEIFVVNDTNELVSASNIISQELKNRGGGVANDGMQIELHPSPTTCRESLISNLFDCLKAAHNLAKEKGLSLSPSFTKSVSEQVLKSLPKDVIALGCEPDLSVYSGSAKILNIDGSKHFKRYCGGHIHLGLLKKEESSHFFEQRVSEIFHSHADEMVRLFDYLVGNTFVMLDHNEENVERRKVYGQAGSYRKQQHGIEYRVLSNFWLQHSSLASLVFLLGRLSTNMTQPTKYLYEIARLGEFVKKVPEKDVEDAINFNDFDLAERNFRKIFGLIGKETKNSGDDACEYISENDIRYILYLNKYPERSTFYDKNFVENWRLNELTRCYEVCGANIGWHNTLAKILRDQGLTNNVDFTNIHLN